MNPTYGETFTASNGSSYPLSFYDSAGSYTYLFAIGQLYTGPESAPQIHTGQFSGLNYASGNYSY